MTQRFNLLLLISTLLSHLAFATESHTDSFNKAVKREFVEKKTISENDLIHFILNLDEEVVQNPIPEHKKTAAFKFTLAYKQFQKLIQKHKNAINWKAVQEFANNLLDESKRVEVDRKTVRAVTEIFWSKLQKRHFLLAYFMLVQLKKMEKLGAGETLFEATPSHLVTLNPQLKLL